MRAVFLMIIALILYDIWIVLKEIVEVLKLIGG